MEQITLLTYTQCKPMFSAVLVHMEYVRSLVPNHRTSWQNQSYMHIAVIIFNPSQAHPFQKLSLMQKPVAITFVCICALVSGVNLNLALPCTSFSCKPAMQANCEPINGVTSKLHTQAAPAESIHMHYTDHHGLSNCICHVCPSLPIACRAVSCILLFSCCAMQMFSSQHEKNMER